jgi:hypothetical protein
MNYKQREKIEDIAYCCGMITVLLFKTIFWAGIAYIVFHFVVKFW